MSQIALHQIGHIKISLIRLSLLTWRTKFSIFLSSINSTLVAMSHAHNKHFLGQNGLLPFLGKLISFFPFFPN